MNYLTNLLALGVLLVQDLTRIIVIKNAYELSKALVIELIERICCPRIITMTLVTLILLMVGLNSDVLLILVLINSCLGDPQPSISLNIMLESISIRYSDLNFTCAIHLELRNRHRFGVITALLRGWLLVFQQLTHINSSDEFEAVGAGEIRVLNLVHMNEPLHGEEAYFACLLILSYHTNSLD